jgi:hypothetical protein
MQQLYTINFSNYKSRHLNEPLLPNISANSFKKANFLPRLKDESTRNKTKIRAGPMKASKTNNSMKTIECDCLFCRLNKKNKQKQNVIDSKLFLNSLNDLKTTVKIERELVDVENFTKIIKEQYNKERHKSRLLSSSSSSLINNNKSYKINNNMNSLTSVRLWKPTEVMNAIQSKNDKHKSSTINDNTNNNSNKLTEIIKPKALNLFQTNSTQIRPINLDRYSNLQKKEAFSSILSQNNRNSNNNSNNSTRSQHKHHKKKKFSTQKYSNPPTTPFE